MPLTLSPSRNMEVESIYWFFQNYVTVPRDPSTNIFIEHILPLYVKAPAQSPLSFATNAVALEVMQMWFTRKTGSHQARDYYGKAMTQLTLILQDEVESKSDEALATVFLFDFYESLRKRFAGYVDSGAHQQGAIALIRHRGEKNFETTTSRRLFEAVRSRHVSYSLQHCRKVMLEPAMRDEETASQPSAQLDLLNAELAELYVLAEEGPKAGMDATEFYQVIVAKALLLDKNLQAWREALPLSWQPARVPPSEIHPSIKAAGMYEDMCEVYSSLEVSHVHNAARSSHFGVLRLISRCQRHFVARGESILNPTLQSYIDQQTQTIIDGFCASIPYHLGNRTTVSLPHEPSEYPPVPDELRRLTNYVDAMGNPSEMTMGDHSRAAAAIGGWFIMTPLLGFLRMQMLDGDKPQRWPFMSKLRPGQLPWIQQQLRRIQRIYLLPYESSEYSRDQRYLIRPLQRPEKGKSWHKLLWSL